MRSKRMQRTRDALVAHARALTAERGLAGFTVEELCEQVGISRRTFFNYFPTKEDAVVGHSDDFFTEEQKVDFIARGAGHHDRPSPTLLSDITHLIVTRSRRHDFTCRGHQLYRDIVRSEPHLLARLVAAGETQQRDFARLIAQREGLPPDHPFPRVVVRLVVGLVFSTVDEFFDDDNHSSFEHLLQRNIAFAQQLLGQRLDLTDPTGNP
ncbi:TetR/AcrR family transcriptional regulator [Rhodococcus chondri]|uniref:TetR/AcrR family transcriptional regulator n=1 Tax=Rhodococcus chondri TaxID=3065941 RepID=A0ABU7JRT9_9NOCA|nr:TetR/AcrR family transcriptional regulator [Rhodococcus sp. CC-R104]MEE2032751.1 TetR/AcrR family transcriptional regulator [Rhodococcus sp. CC-R104]